MRMIKEWWLIGLVMLPLIYTAWQTGKAFVLGLGCGC